MHRGEELKGARASLVVGGGARRTDDCTDPPPGLDCLWAGPGRERTSRHLDRTSKRRQPRLALLEPIQLHSSNPIQLHFQTRERSRSAAARVIGGEGRLQRHRYRGIRSDGASPEQRRRPGPEPQPGLACVLPRLPAQAARLPPGLRRRLRPPLRGMDALALGAPPPAPPQRPPKPGPLVPVARHGGGALLLPPAPRGLPGSRAQHRMLPLLRTSALLHTLSSFLIFILGYLFILLLDLETPLDSTPSRPWL